MSNEPRYRAICDLSEAEYLQQQELAASNPEKHPPLLEMRNGPGQAWFNESHCGRIAADAHEAAFQEATDAAQLAAESALSKWPPEQKLRFMQDAAENWMPPVGEEMCHWWGSDTDAEAFLGRYPEIRDILGDDRKATTK